MVSPQLNVILSSSLELVDGLSVLLLGGGPPAPATHLIFIPPHQPATEERND